MNRTIKLTTKNILEKKFEIDFRGYRAEEVDEFLDKIIEDYQQYEEIKKDLQSQINDLRARNSLLDLENKDLLLKIKEKDKTIEALSNSTNATMASRLSSLESKINKNNNV